MRQNQIEKFAKSLLLGMVICAVLLGGILVIPKVAYACSCAMQTDINEARNGSAAVFEGEVLSIQQPNQLFGGSSSNLVSYTIRVNEVWKGEIPAIITVKSAMSEASCGYEFQVGGRYLVYAGLNNETLHVSLCSRTVAYQAASPDLAVLGQGTTPPQIPVDEEKFSKKMLWIGIPIVLIITLISYMLIRRKAIKS